MPSQEITRFWKRAHAALDEVPMGAVVEPVEETDVYSMEGHMKSRSISRVTLTGLDGVRFRAFYAAPTGIPPAGGWPAILALPGYDFIMSVPLQLVHYGYATLSLFPRGQGISEEEWKWDYGTPLVWHIDDPERYYYRGAYMDCVRGLDFLVSRPEVNASRMGVWGFSQGGALTLATAALDRRVAAAVAGVPWLCNFPVSCEITEEPYSELCDYLAQHPEKRDATLANLTYFDSLNLADAISCPVLISGAILDEGHPLRTVMPVFESIRALKSIVIYPDLEHADRVDFTNHGKAWMDRYMH